MELKQGGQPTMKEKLLKFKSEKKAERFEYYGLEPEMSLQNVQFAPTENEYLNENEVEKEE